MPTHDDLLDEPLIHPRVIRRLRERPKLINFGMREEFLEEMEKVVENRRQPGNIAEKASEAAFERFEEAGIEVTRNRTQNTLERANSSILRGL